MADSYTLANTMLGKDALVADDQVKLTADQADDAGAHTAMAQDLKDNGEFILIAADLQSAKDFSLNADGTIDIVTKRVANPPPVPAPAP